jgi:hypothetical protein
MNLVKAQDKTLENRRQRRDACRREADSRFMTSGKPHVASKASPNFAKTTVAMSTQDAIGN